MKTKYLLLGVLVMLLYSCNDSFMQRTPEDKINDANYWNSPNDLQIYTNQFYSSLRAFDGWYADNQTDNQTPQNKDAFTWDTYPVPSSDASWSKDGWSRIRNCNYFLTHYSKVVGDQAAINTSVGEILFFKALEYYGKVSRFGDVPWLNTDLQTNSPELLAPRDPRTLVIDSVCANLDLAISYLPASSTDNRLNKYAALALKSRICLFEGTFEKYHGISDGVKYLTQAATAAKQIMDSNLFALYSTGNPSLDYRNLFIQENDQSNPEAIMYVSYVTSLRTHNNVRQLKEGNTGFTEDFVQSYLCTDGQPIAVSPLYQGDAKFANAFANRDPRMKQTIYTSDQAFVIYPDGSADSVICPEFNTNATSGYRIFKYVSAEQSQWQMSACTLDDIIFRYGEVLLNYAEAEAELGTCDQAVLDQSINLLRDRVGMPHLTTTPVADPNEPAWPVPVTPLINEIRRERRVELAAEGFRFNDLLRWAAGKLLEGPLTTVGATDPSTGAYHVLYGGTTRVWNDKEYLYPLPTVQLSLNPNLVQNPGW